MIKIILTDYQLQSLAFDLSRKINAELDCAGDTVRVYAVPRGGVSAAYLVRPHLESRGATVHITSEPGNATFILDDLVDSGKTRERLLREFPGKPFYALIEKGKTDGFMPGSWLVFPWEITEKHDESATDIFTRLLQYIGEDPARGGLLETPKRMAKAWEHWCGGYKLDPISVIKTFEDGAEGYDEMIHTMSIPFYSHCEHHLAPFFGTVDFAYIPDKRIVGLSKFSRLIDIFARRLQVQERLTVQIVDSFLGVLAPRGAACVVRARHLCMESRGIAVQGTITTTSAMRGVFKDHPETRAEFFSLCNGHYSSH